MCLTIGSKKLSSEGLNRPIGRLSSYLLRRGASSRVLRGLSSSLLRGGSLLYLLRSSRLGLSRLFTLIILLIARVITNSVKFLKSIYISITVTRADSATIFLHY